MADKKHWLRPLKGRIMARNHLLLYIDADDTQPVLKSRWNRAWLVTVEGKALGATFLGEWASKDGLEHVLDNATKGRGTLTIWLYRGWDDLVLSGLAELMDCKACLWRYAMLDGQRVLIRGSWRGKSIVISSIANWTNHWRYLTDNVMGDGEVRRCLTAFDGHVGNGLRTIYGPERRFIGTWSACASACASLGCTSMPPSVAGAALQVWRRWLGPRLTVEMAAIRKRTKSLRMRSVQIVAPSPFRTERSRQAERHVVYSLLTRQLRRGLVDEPVMVVDLKSAYLLSLCCCPIPLQYDKVLHRPSNVELAEKLQGHTGHALVRLQTSGNVYPARLGNKTFPAQGRFWTWLAGSELALALATGECKEVWTAYLWTACAIDPETASGAMQISGMFKRSSCHAIAAAWRGIYSALVGRFAGRRRVWVDIPHGPGFGDWSEWTRANAATGEIQQCRSIAGKQQKLADRQDTSDSVPLLFACVTSHVRTTLMIAASIAGLENVACANADSLWTTRAGWQKIHTELTKSGLSAEMLAVKATYDRVWFTGKSVCVVEHKGELIIKSPGCHDGAVLDEEQKCHGLRSIPWSQCESIKPAKGVRRRKVCFAGDRVIRDFGHAAEVLPLGEPLDDLLLREELLRPVRHERNIADE